ncbi:tyrosine-type recombinase/integrase [Anaeromyxobacter oryzae]|uniref:tyrosine-type recombinase/integrase n=1 Tax=Anaeromyxobacter oryzae TaxID=2918170 RepID=UPI0020BFFA2A|nr:tyrosine-type recombinase/integrase [Anaeromyxobacter oryzae]
MLYNDEGRTVNATMLWEWMRNATAAAGLEKRGGLHSLRHTFCSHLAMKAVTARTIQELAGHTTLTVTMRYMHLSPGAKEAAIRSLDASPTTDPGTTRAQAAVPP